MSPLGPSAWRGRCRAATLVVSALLAIFVGCAPGDVPRDGLAPTRGYLLLSIDGLRADRLAAWRAPSPEGSVSARPASDAAPELDRLAERGAVFLNAFTPHPETLTAATTLLSGLSPAEHGVYPPGLRLSRHLPTLPERFAANGHLTAAFTTSTWLSPRWGGDRGFGRYGGLAEPGDGSVSPETQAEEAIDGLLGFLAGPAANGPFFAYLQLQMAGGEGEPADPETAHRWYDERLRRVAELVGALFEHLEAQGLLAETTVVLTAAHGYELGEHGRLGHGQLYPETSRVPLIVLHPAVEPGQRIERVVQTTDVAATLARIAALRPAAPTSGVDLTPLLGGEAGTARGRTGAPDAGGAGGGWARVEAGDEMRIQRGVVVGGENGPTMAVETSWVPEADGTWIRRVAVFDVDEHDTEIQIVSYRIPRTVEVAVAGAPAGRYEVPARWIRAPLPPATGPGRRRITLAAADCEVPEDPDARCLSFKVRGPTISRLEVFDLGADPLAEEELEADAERRRGLAGRLAPRPSEPLARPEAVGLEAAGSDGGETR